MREPSDCSGLLLTRHLNYTQNQWKRNTCIFDIFSTWTCPWKFCFHQTTVLYIFYKKIILCIDWVSICIVSNYLFENKLYDSLICSAWVICIFASFFLSWLSRLDFPNIKMSICLLHIKIFEDEILLFFYNFRAGGSGNLEGRYLSCVWTFTSFRLYLALI